MRIGWRKHRQAFIDLDEKNDLDYFPRLHLRNLLVLMDFCIPLVPLLFFDWRRFFHFTNLCKLISLFWLMVRFKIMVLLFMRNLWIAHWYSLRLLYALFAMLKKTNYLRAIGYHFLLLEYHQGNLSVFFDSMLEHKHPSIEMQRKNFGNFNGEDIELANRELAKSQKSTKGRSEVVF